MPAVHMRNHRAAEVEDAGEVDRKNLLPGFERLLPERCGVAGDARVIDKNVNVARAGEDLLSGPVYSLRIGNVGLYGKDALTNLGSLLL